MTAATIASGIRLNESCTTFFEPVSASSDSTLYQNYTSSKKDSNMKTTGDSRDQQLIVPSTRKAIDVPPSTRVSSKKQRAAKKEYDRLRRRKVLFKKKCKITDVSLCFALSGLLLMITETELSLAEIYSKVIYILNKSILKTKRLTTGF
ncbi:hypothetical protein ACOME3_009111 [Neoechinorhynchus agilis]